MKTNERPAVLVTGDVVLDHNLYVGQRFTPDSTATCGTMYAARPGGAMLTYGLLEAMSQIPPAKDEAVFSAADLAFGLKETTADALQDWPANFKFGAVWEQFDGPKKGESVWRLFKNLGYGPKQLEGTQQYPATPAGNLEKICPRVLVIDDGGLGFRVQTASPCWPPALFNESMDQPLQWVILKMSSPLARGDLWRHLINRWSDRLIVIVAADNLRRQDVRVTRGLSWESTVDDLVEEVQSNPAIAGLNLSRHLVITLRGDAALWLDHSAIIEQRRCCLVFDRERGEGEWDDGISGGNAFGYLSAVTASLAWHLRDIDTAAPCNLTLALKAGLSASRFLREYGHGPVKGIGKDPAFPFHLAAQEIRSPAHRYALAEVRCPTTACEVVNNSPESARVEVCDAAPTTQWTILGQSTHSDAFPGPLFGPARRLALLGPSVLADVPCARFGKLLTMDRREIEALRSLRQLMLSYRDSGPQKQPLSLAVFGAPGSGKSFGLKQIAEGVFGDKNPILEFNLSQFEGPKDLIGAYHQVRDHALSGKTPIVFWDEFDSRNYFWLQYLLAPMQDGSFQESQLTHSIGKSVFVFAGGTSRDFAHFGPTDEAHLDKSQSQQKFRAEFVTAKGPDFKSRLAGYLNVLGPNPRQIYSTEKARNGSEPWEDDPTDADFPVRRAILLRSMLALVKEMENNLLQIDRGLLTALLEIGHYRHGARSLEKLLLQMRDRGGLPLRRAYLPSDELLALYVDNVRDFHALIRRSYAFLAQAEKLAPVIHQDWRDNLPESERSNSYNKPYEELDQEGQAANVAAAMRIPEILALIGLRLIEGQATPAEEEAVCAFLKNHLEILAQAEHDGWADQKRVEGWWLDPNDDRKARGNKLLVEYPDLPEEQKDKDRRTIANYPKYARKAGFEIVGSMTRKTSQLTTS